MFLLSTHYRNIIMEKRFIYDSTMLGYLEQNIGSIADREFAQIGEDSTVTEAAKTHA